MLKKETSIFYFVATTLIFLSCEKRGVIDLSTDDLGKYQTEKFQNYKNVYSDCLDSLKLWVSDSLQVTQSIFYYDWMPDSTFVFNADSNRFISTINSSSRNMKSAVADDIMEFGGAKINNKWYFFFLSSTMVVPREYYKEDIYEPLTFEELSVLAHKEIIKHYLIKNDDGTFSPNEKEFNRLFVEEWSCGDRLCRNAKERDSIILLYAKDQHKFKLKRQEIIEIKEEMAKSVRPELPKKKWWEFWK